MLTSGSVLVAAWLAIAVALAPPGDERQADGGVTLSWTAPAECPDIDEVRTPGTVDVTAVVLLGSCQ